MEEGAFYTARQLVSAAESLVEEGYYMVVQEVHCCNFWNITIGAILPLSCFHEKV
jgi:hypothetical protein